MNIEVTLPRPHPAQQKILNSKARWKVVQAGRRFGKSNLACNAVMDYMIHGKQTAYVTPIFSLGKLFYNELLKTLPAELIKSKNSSELSIELITKGSIKFFSGENLDAFRGRKFHFIVLDEAAYLNDLESAWLNSIRPTLTDYRGSALFISTPRGKNYFHALWQKGNAGEKDFESFHFTSYDNPYLNKEEIDEARTLLTLAAFNQEYLAIAGENVNNPFGADYIKNNTITTLSTKPPIVFGIDIARTTDWTVITGLDEDGVTSYFDRFQKGWVDTKNTIANLPSGIDKILDNTGVGSVLAEELTLMTDNLILFTFTTQTKPKMIMELIKAIEQGKLKFNEVTANELSVFEYRISPSTGHISYQAQSGFHDDCVASLGLANHWFDNAITNQNWHLYT